MARIELNRVSKRYGDIVAVNDVCAIIEDNEFFCFFGPPSSGKTTLLRLILGLETPDSGEILIDGRNVNRVPAAQRNLSMVFQNLALFPHLTAEQESHLSAYRASSTPIRNSVAASRDRRQAPHLARIAQASRAPERRRTAARCDRPGADERGAGLPDGRSDLCTRRQAARGNEGRTETPAAGHRTHPGLRHP